MNKTEQKTICINSRNQIFGTLSEAIEASQAPYTCNERFARELCSAIYGEPVHCETVYINNGRKKVCVMEYGAMYEEFATWKEAVRCFIATHGGSYSSSGAMKMDVKSDERSQSHDVWLEHNPRGHAGGQDSDVNWAVHSTWPTVAAAERRLAEVIADTIHDDDRRHWRITTT